MLNRPGFLTFVIFKGRGKNGKDGRRQQLMQLGQPRLPVACRITENYLLNWPRKKRYAQLR